MPASVKNKVLSATLAASVLTVTLTAATPTRLPAAEPPRTISPQDRALLEDLERRSILYFWNESDPSTGLVLDRARDRKSTRLNSSHLGISYAVFCLKKKKKK